MRTAIITGASSGIGLELAKIHAATEGKCILVARSTDALNALKSEIEKTYGTEVKVFTCDLSIDQEVKSLIERIKKEESQIDFLINNAGFGDFGHFAEADWEKTANMIDLNVRTLTHLTRAFLPQMVSNGFGRIMNVASIAAFMPGPYMSVYYATKAYVLSFSEGLSEELKNTGVKVTALCPGPTKSKFQEKSNLGKSKLMDRFSMASSAEVAHYGYNKMIEGKAVAVQGFQNKIFSASVGLLPRKTVRWVVSKIQAQK